MKESTDIARGRQPGLFRLDNPLVMRFGHGFFVALPRVPGVYQFFDAADRLLYIGQSASLRDRLGSYRHVTPDRHPRRTLRLVARIHRIEWETCATPAEAIERERVLLLERRPPFNRAGTWQGPPWWLTVEAGPAALVLGLRREEGGTGPLPPSFRHVFGSVARCLYRVSFPGLPLHRYPAGLMRPLVPMTLTLPFPAAEADEALRILADCAAGNTGEILLALAAMPPAESLQQEEFWLGEIEQLVSWGRRTRPYVPPPATALGPAWNPELPL